jgi:hypothetical protein
MRPFFGPPRYVPDQRRILSIDWANITFGIGESNHTALTGRIKGVRPSRKRIRQKSVSRLRQKVGDLLGRHNVAPWSEVRDQLNRILRGWSNYFGYEDASLVYAGIDNHEGEDVGLYDTNPKSDKVCCGGFNRAWSPQIRSTNRRVTAF